MGDQRTGGIGWTDELVERFWGYVDRKGPDVCWNWTAGRFSEGMRYGQFRLGKKKVKAHRAAYELLIGPIPDGMRVLHRCDNPICCNAPAHHFVGTDADNAADREAKGRGRSSPPPGMPGEANPAAKLDRTAVAAVRALRQNGNTLRSIAENVGISQSQVSNIVNGRSWRDG